MTLWTTSPAAQRLFADCQIKPPVASYIRSQFTLGREMDREGWTYDETDSRVMALGRLRDAAIPDLDDAPAFGTPEREAFRAAYFLQHDFTVDIAITAALAADHYEAMALGIAA